MRPYKYYDDLEVSRFATSGEIRRAYRFLARKYHPDKNPANNEASKKMSEINEAYKCLRDQGNKKKYDDNLGRIAEDRDEPFDFFSFFSKELKARREADERDCKRKRNDAYKPPKGDIVPSDKYFLNQLFTTAFSSVYTCSFILLSDYATILNFEIAIAAAKAVFSYLKDDKVNVEKLIYEVGTSLIEGAARAIGGALTLSALTAATAVTATVAAPIVIVGGFTASLAARYALNELNSDDKSYTR